MLITIQNKHFIFDSASARLAAFAGVVLAAGGCLAGQSEDGAQAATSQSVIAVPFPVPLPPTRYKVETYNVQLRPVAACVTSECDDEIYNMSNESRAGLIASKLLADDPDVIVLNEPFHEGAR